MRIYQVYVSFLLLSVIAIGVMIPAASGFIRTIQFFCVLTLSLFAISKGRTLSFSIIYHASAFIPVTAIGLIHLLIKGLSFGKIRKSSEVLKLTGN